MMKAVIVEAKNTMLPVPNKSNTIVKPRAYATWSIPISVSPKPTVVTVMTVM